MTAPAWVEYAAREFEDRPRRFATPGALAQHCDPTVRQTPALDLFDRAVVDLIDGHAPRQLLNAPPQTGKSQRISRWAPLWMLTVDPTLRIVIVSAEKELAVRWGRQIKRDLEAHPDLGLTLKQDSQAAGRWETAQGGGLFCTGVLAGTTGRPIDVLLVDDPVKDRASAESGTMRARVWDFWENDAGTRARKTLIMSTRWHVADLHGQLLEKEPGRWSTLALPAIAEGPDDPLGRAPGAEIRSANPDLHPPGYYHEQLKIVSPYVWTSVYQQRPTAAEGGIFKRGDWRYWRPGDTGRIVLDGAVYDLAGSTRFATIDLATSTRTSADFTVAAAWAITLSGDLVLLDRVRQRVPDVDHEAFLAPLRQRWLGAYDVTYIEQSMQTSSLVYALGRKGVPVQPLRPDKDKLTRALTAADLVRQHRVWLPADAAWLDEFLDEHADFPASAHDDQVDCTAYAANVAVTRWVAPETAEQTMHAHVARADAPIDLMSASLGGW